VGFLKLRVFKILLIEMTEVHSDFALLAVLIIISTASYIVDYQLFNCYQSTPESEHFV